MRPYDLHFFPYPPLYLLGFGLLLGVLLVLLRLGLIRYVYERLGLSRRTAVLVLFAALLGSGINIPLAQLPAQRLIEPKIVDAFGMQYVIPTLVMRQSTIIAINLGGAVIPILLSLYLMAQSGIRRQMLVVLGLVTLLTHLMAHPVPGVGIALPPLVPSLATAALALLLDWNEAPRTAFIAGSLGTLIGADLLNLGIVQNLGSPVVSIGGAGTFDGVFVIGIVAVVLAGLPRSFGKDRSGRTGSESPARSPRVDCVSSESTRCQKYPPGKFLTFPRNWDDALENSYALGTQSIASAFGLLHLVPPYAPLFPRG